MKILGHSSLQVLTTYVERVSKEKIKLKSDPLKNMG